MRWKNVSLEISALTLGLLTASLAGAAGDPRTPGHRTVSNQAAVAPTNAVAPSLFVPVPGEEGAGERSLKFQVRLNDRPFLTETLAVEATQDDIAVELLARDSATLARLFRLAERPEARLSVSVLLDGSSIQELSFEEMATASAKLTRSRDFHPRPASSRVELFMPEPSKPDFLSSALEKGMQPDPACEQVCNDDYLFCSEVCDQRGSCGYCWTNYQNCAASCPQVCVDPKKVYELTSLQLLGVVTHSTACYELPNQTDYHYGEWFDYSQYNWKSTRIRRTEYCNGTYSDQVVSVSYSSTYCHYRTRLTCFWPNTRLNSWQICN